MPYFGKQTNILTHFQHEQKRKPIQGFLEVTEITEREKEPDTGLFSFRYYLLKIREYLVKHCQPGILCSPPLMRSLQ